MNLTLIFSIIVFATVGQSFSLADPREPHSQAEALGWSEYFLRHPELQSMTLGVEMKGKSPLELKGGDAALPASTEKLITAAAALKILGAHFRFQNSFHADFDPTTLVLSKVRFQVSGDPTFSNPFEAKSAESVSLPIQPRLEKIVEPRLKRLMDSLAEKGIKKVVGPIEVLSDHPELDEIKRPEGWKDSWNLECMAMMQTSFQSNGNCGTLMVSSSKKAKWITEGVDIPITLNLIRSETRSSSIEVHPKLNASGRIVEYRLSGRMGENAAYFNLPVHSGTRWLKKIFIQALHQNGIQYEESPKITTAQASALEPIDLDLSSEELLKVLTKAVQESVNGVMDRVFFEISFQTGRSGEEVLLAFLRDLLGNASLLRGVEIHDGCGLDTRDRMRPDSLYQFLESMEPQPTFQDFFSTLAVAGLSGTLRNRITLTNSPLTNQKIFGKTGTLNGVDNLVGYFMTPRQQLEPFVVFAGSDFGSTQARVKIDEIILNFAAQNAL